MKTPFQPETNAGLGKDDAVSKDEDLSEDQDYLVDGTLWEIQNMDMDSTQSDKIIFTSSLVKFLDTLPPKIRHGFVSD